MSDERTSGGVSEARRAELLRCLDAEQEFQRDLRASEEVELPLGDPRSASTTTMLTGDDLRALLSSAPVVPVELTDGEIDRLIARTMRAVRRQEFFEAPQRRPAPAPASDEEIDDAIAREVCNMIEGDAWTMDIALTCWRACEHFHGIAAASETQREREG